ncbi:MAG: radical SAM protein [Anaerolineae bacterium]
MQLKIYHPIPKFPPISLSGARCQLNCQHCNRAYLRGMTPAENADDLLRVCRRLKAEGAIGALISGGSTREGSILNLEQRVAALQQVKAETGLILNLHPGLMSAATAQALSGAIDFASLELPKNRTIRDIFGLDATTEDYVATYDRLREAGIPVVPHVAVYDGDEDRVLSHIAPDTGRVPPESIVVIVFTPTRGTEMAEVKPPTPEMVGGVIARLRAGFPDTEIALGCMRPRSRDLRVALELAALDAGATRMVLPAQQTLEVAQERGYKIARFDACCALPRALEPRARRLPS